MVVLGLVGAYYLNIGLANRDIRVFREKRNLIAANNPRIFDDYAEILGRKFPARTPRAQIVKEFVDCDERDSVTTFTDSRKDGFLEVYVYNFGFWGRLELSANYDTAGLRKENEFGRFFQYDPYDL